MKEEMRLKDLVAVPFSLIGYLFFTIALKVGGQWTAKRFLEIFKI